jgi:membrane protease YdiL (CAAX protease family)
MASEFEVNRRAIFWFLLSTFVATWSLWGLLWVFNISLLNPWFLVFAFGGTLVPGLAALTVIATVLHESWRTTTLDRLGVKRFYLWAWFLPLSFAVAAAGLSILVGTTDLGRDSTVSDALRSSRSALSVWFFVSQFVFVIPFAVAEELGWRGFLLPRLMHSGIGEWQALAATGAVWGAWHAPLIVRGYNYPQHPHAGLILIVIFCVLMGTVIGWLRLASGSVWVAAAAHASVNMTSGLVPYYFGGKYDSAFGGTIFSMVGWIPIVAFIAWLASTRRLPVDTPEAQ